jgi:hypothetical protein
MPAEKSLPLCAGRSGTKNEACDTDTPFFPTTKHQQVEDY